MKREAATLDYEYYKRDCDFEDLKYAVAELTHATEAQFKEIKNEKWYNRLFNMVTFSQKGKKRMAEQIGSLAQAQRIFMEILVRLSAADERVAGLVSACMEDIRRLQENDVYLLQGIKTLEDACILGIRETKDIFYVEVEEDGSNAEANTPFDESKGLSKVPEFTVVYERGQSDFAEQIGVDLRVKGKRVRVIPVQDENMDTINQIDWRIYVGKGGTASRILKSGKIDTIMNQFGCLLKTPRGSHLIVLYQEEDYDFFACRDEFIAYYQDMVKQLGFENEELASKLQVLAKEKAVYEDFDADNTVSMNALDGVLSKISDISDSIDDYGCSSNPLRRVSSVLFRIASLPVVAASTTTAIGGATGEITAKAVSDVKADIEFDKKVAAQVQQELLRMMLTNYIDEKQ